MELNTIFFVGPQGSGKGTQAKLLAKKLGFFYWEMGGILREVASTDTDLGKKVKSLVDAGVLLTDEDLYEVVRSKLSLIPKEDGVIFDGVPRRIGQAEFLFDYLKEQGRELFTTLFVTLPKEESFKRLLARAEREHRADDTQEKIEYRLNQYEEAIGPVLNYLKERTHFTEIDGLPDVAVVTKTIDTALEIT